MADVSLREVGGLGRDNNDVRLRIECGDVFGGIVARFIDAASIEEFEQRRFGAGELIMPRGAGAGAKAGADRGFIGAGEIMDDGGFAGLRFAEEPENGSGGLGPEVGECR
jgi:hypothetical protein